MTSFPRRFGEEQEERVDTDAAIRQTDSDAAVARFSAVQKRYLQDPFIKHLLPRGAQFQAARPPLINVGTYVRSQGIDALVNQWLSLSEQEGKRCQIVSLGAGSDTRFWRISVRMCLIDWANAILSRNTFRQAGPHKSTLAAYIEIDFTENTTKKAMAIRKSKDLSVLLGKPEEVTLGKSILVSILVY